MILAEPVIADKILMLWEGFGSYGPPPGWLPGARIINLQEGQHPFDAESWIRLQNGSRIDQELEDPVIVEGQQQVECDARKWPRCPMFHL